MHFRTMTIDHFMQLDELMLDYALRTFQREVDEKLALVRASTEAAPDETLLDELSYALLMRKVIKNRLEELRQDAQLTAVNAQLAAAA